jgi:hypothetical protein
VIESFLKATAIGEALSVGAAWWCGGGVFGEGGLGLADTVQLYTRFGPASRKWKGYLFWLVLRIESDIIETLV